MAAFGEQGPQPQSADGLKTSLQGLYIVGVNHRTASAALRDRVYQDPDDLPAALTRLKAAGLEDCLLISTCDRIEAVCLAPSAERVHEVVRKNFADWAGLTQSDLREELFLVQGEEALRHLFSVAASLDSQVIGEPQVLGQVKQAHRIALDCGAISSRMDTILQSALSAARRVRRETPIAEQPVTIAASALRVARDLHGKLARCDALLLGLGEMGELLAGELKAAGLRSLMVSHRFSGRAEKAAQRLRCHWVDWQDWIQDLERFDIIITAQSSGQELIALDQLDRTLAARKRRPTLLLDAGIPRDLPGSASDLEGAFLFDLDDLERVAQQGKAKREGASLAAWKVIGDELQRFMQRSEERAAVPAVQDLRGYIEGLRDEVLADRNLDAEEATRRLVQRLLHHPSVALRESAAEDKTSQHRLEEALKTLFPLDGDKENKGES